MPNSHLISFLMSLTSRNRRDVTFGSLAPSLVAGGEESILDSDLTDDLRLACRDGPGSSGPTPIEKAANCSVACSTGVSVCCCSSLGGGGLGSSCHSAGLIVPKTTLLDLSWEPFSGCCEASDSVVIVGDMEPNSILCGTTCSEALA